MTSPINKNDRELLASIAEYKALTVKQLSALSQRSGQVIRRRIRDFEEEGLIIIKMQGYGRGQGRPEDLIFLAEKGKAALMNEGIASGQDFCAPDKGEDFFSIDHLLLVNWFRIHLLQIEKAIPQISVHYLSLNSPSLAGNNGDSPSFSERIPADGKMGKFIEFIPDGVFSITYKEVEKKTLLFFLEVDRGTETIASVDRGHKDIRQKVLNYQALFRSGAYKRYERVFDSKLNGFRLLFLANSGARLIGLCGLVREMPPADFIWLVDQEKMFSYGLAAKIWARGGRNDDPPQSILGPKLSYALPVIVGGTNPVPQDQTGPVPE